MVVDAPSYASWVNVDIDLFSMSADALGEDIANDLTDQYVFYRTDSTFDGEDEIFHYCLVSGDLDFSENQLVCSAPVVYLFDSRGGFSVEEYDLEDSMLLPDFEGFAYSSILDDNLPALVDNHVEGVSQNATLFALCGFFLFYVLDRLLLSAKFR